MAQRFIPLLEACKANENFATSILEQLSIVDLKDEALLPSLAVQNAPIAWFEKLFALLAIKCPTFDIRAASLKALSQAILFGRKELLNYLIDKCKLDDNHDIRKVISGEENGGSFAFNEISLIDPDTEMMAIDFFRIAVTAQNKPVIDVILKKMIAFKHTLFILSLPTILASEDETLIKRAPYQLINNLQPQARLVLLRGIIALLRASTRAKQILQMLFSAMSGRIATEREDLFFGLLDTALFDPHKDVKLILNLIDIAFSHFIHLPKTELIYKMIDALNQHRAPVSQVFDNYFLSLIPKSIGSFWLNLLNYAQSEKYHVFAYHALNHIKCSSLVPTKLLEKFKDLHSLISDTEYAGPFSSTLFLSLEQADIQAFKKEVDKYKKVFSQRQSKKEKLGKNDLIFAIGLAFLTGDYTLTLEWLKWLEALVEKDPDSPLVASVYFTRYIVELFIILEIRPTTDFITLYKNNIAQLFDIDRGVDSTNRNDSLVSVILDALLLTEKRSFDNTEQKIELLFAKLEPLFAKYKNRLSDKSTFSKNSFDCLYAIKKLSEMFNAISPESSESGIATVPETIPKHLYLMCKIQFNLNFVIKSIYKSINADAQSMKEQDDILSCYAAIIDTFEKKSKEDAKKVAREKAQQQEEKKKELKKLDKEITQATGAISLHQSALEKLNSERVILEKTVALIQTELQLQITEKEKLETNKSKLVSDAALLKDRQQAISGELIDLEKALHEEETRKAAMPAASRQQVAAATTKTKTDEPEKPTLKSSNIKPDYLQDLYTLRPSASFVTTFSPKGLQTIATICQLGLSPFTAELCTAFSGKIFLTGGVIRSMWLKMHYQIECKIQDYDYCLFATVDEVKHFFPGAQIQGDDAYAGIKLTAPDHSSHELTLFRSAKDNKKINTIDQQIKFLKEHAQKKRDFNMNTGLARINDVGFFQFVYDDGEADFIDKKFRLPRGQTDQTIFILHPERVLRLARLDLELSLLFGERFSFDQPVLTALYIAQTDAGRSDFLQACVEKREKLARLYQKYEAQFDKMKWLTFIISHYSFLLPPLIYAGTLPPQQANFILNYFKDVRQAVEEMYSRTETDEKKYESVRL